MRKPEGICWNPSNALNLVCVQLKIEKKIRMLDQFAPRRGNERRLKSFCIFFDVALNLRSRNKTAIARRVIRKLEQKLCHLHTRGLYSSSNEKYIFVCSRSRRVDDFHPVL